MSSADTEHALDEQAAAVGARIRAMRRTRGMTLVALAAAAELSHPFLSQLERGLARPSMASLQRIAHALGSSQVELLTAQSGDAPDQPASVLIRAGRGNRGAYGAAEARMLTTGSRAFQPIDVRGVNRDIGESYTHAEDEFLYVLDGHVRVDLGPEGDRELGPGDSLYYAGGTPHRWCAVDDAGYRLLVVKETPRDVR